MSFDETLLNKWKTAVEEREDVVFSFLSRYGFKRIKNRGSHYTFEHPSLAKCVSRFPSHIQETSLKSGRLVIATTGGQKVKGYMLRRIIEACEYIEEYEDLERKKGGAL